MSCGVMIAAALLLTDPAGVAQTPAPAPETSAPLLAEPLFADIVARSQQLKVIVDGWLETGFDASAFAGFRRDAESLAALDMDGHVNLRDRGIDGDLRCILRGISEDMPGRLDAVETAASEPARNEALLELSHLLDDNAAVVLAPEA